MYRILLCMVLMVAVDTAQAATEFSDSIPVELAQVLILSPGGEPSTIYRDMPDDFPDLLLPDSTTVIGSVSQPGWSQTVALKAQRDMAQVRTEIEAAIEAAGWNVIPMVRPDRPDVGFVSDAPVPERGNRYCHDDMPGNLSVSAMANDIMLINNQLFTGAQMTCAEQIEQSELSSQRFLGGFSSAGVGVRDYLPRLELPEQRTETPVVVNRLGGSSSNEWETQHNLSLDWSLQQLLDHFTPQLRDQGWALADTHVGEFYATSTWAREVEDDRTIMAILGVLENGDGNFELKLRVLRQGNR